MIHSPKPYRPNYSMLRPVKYRVSKPARLQLRTESLSQSSSKNIEVYGEMHRYIPYLAKNAGFKKIGEKVVHHQARKFGKTKFGGLNRFFNGYLDLISLWFLSAFGVKPMHFFGLLGSLMFIFGFISVIIVGATKLYHMHNGMAYRLVTDSPYFICRSQP